LPKNPAFNYFFLRGVLSGRYRVFILVPTKNVPENIAVTSTENETYFGAKTFQSQEPFEVRESFLVKEAYPGTSEVQDITFAGGVISNYIPLK